jgi:hypothetical protein
MTRKGEDVEIRFKSPNLRLDRNHLASAPCQVLRARGTIYCQLTFRLLSTCKSTILSLYLYLKTYAGLADDH